MDSLWKEFINTGSVEAYLRYRKSSEKTILDIKESKREVRKNGF